MQNFKVLFGFLLLTFSTVSLAGVYGPSSSSSGNFSISWDLYEGSEMGCGEPIVYIDGPYGSTIENTSYVYTTSYSFSNLYDGTYDIYVEFECEDGYGYEETVQAGHITVTVTNNPEPTPPPAVYYPAPDSAYENNPDPITCEEANETWAWHELATLRTQRNSAVLDVSEKKSERNRVKANCDALTSYTQTCTDEIHKLEYELTQAENLVEELESDIEDSENDIYSGNFTNGYYDCDGQL